jgi:putative transposase
MARPLRLEFPGALYHVISRGNERAPIFFDDIDRSGFLDLLSSVVVKEMFQLHAYCLLGNHYHLLLETPVGRLSYGMHRLNGQYAQRFNRRHERYGHLFEGRFKAILIEREPHLLELHRYIVLNPVRAGIVNRPEEWKWSSYRATSGQAARPPWLEVAWTLCQFGPTPAEGRRAFAQFVELGISRAPETGPLRNQLFMGSEGFLARMQDLLQSRAFAAEVPVAQRTPRVPSVLEIQEAVSRYWNVAVPHLRHRRAGPAKLAAIYLARKLTHSPAREIAETFGIKRGRVANVVAEVEGGKHPELRSRLDAIMADLRQPN